MVYSDHQRLELEKEFHYSRYITIRRKAELAQALNLTERQVNIFKLNVIIDGTVKDLQLKSYYLCEIFQFVSAEFRYLKYVRINLDHCR